MSLPQLKKPEQPSAGELGIREEIHWFRLFSHTDRENVPYYCSDQEVSAIRKTSASGGLATRLGIPGEKLPSHQGKVLVPELSCL